MAYASQPWVQDGRFFEVLNGVQVFTVPQTGMYDITAAGALLQTA